MSDPLSRGLSRLQRKRGAFGHECQADCPCVPGNNEVCAREAGLWRGAHPKEYSWGRTNLPPIFCLPPLFGWNMAESRLRTTSFATGEGKFLHFPPYPPPAPQQPAANALHPEFRSVSPPFLRRRSCPSHGRRAVRGRGSPDGAERRPKAALPRAALARARLWKRHAHIPGSWGSGRRRRPGRWGHGAVRCDGDQRTGRLPDQNGGPACPHSSLPGPGTEWPGRRGHHLTRSRMCRLWPRSGVQRMCRKRCPAAPTPGGGGGRAAHPIARRGLGLHP